METIRAFTDYMYTPERHTIGAFNLELREKLSEGGYAYVYKAIDLATNKEYAVKKSLCQSPELLEMAEQEINIMKSLPIHDNIVQYYDSIIKNQSGTQVAMIVMELCTGGTLVNLLEKYNGVLSLPQIFYIMKEICSGVQAIHQAGFMHRDIKIENILLHNKKFKLCDFGSCSNQIYDLSNATRQQLLTYQEKFERETTLMYRPPEMIDLYTRHIIDFKGDSWMLGCVLFTLAFCKHPFQDQSQLAIVNAHYNFPSVSRFDEKFHGLISWILNPSPIERPSIGEILNALDNYETINSFSNTHKTIKRVPKRIDRDLTEEEIQAEIIKIKREMEEVKEKPKKKQENNIWVVPIPSAPNPQAASNTNVGWAKF